MKPYSRVVSLIVLLAVSTITEAQMIPEKKINVIQVKSKNFNEAPKKVFIKNFKVYYQMIAEAEKTIYGGRQLGGGSYTGNATARLAVGVEGVNADDLQKLTNEIFNGYVNKLKGMGMEIYSSKDYPNLEFFEDDELLAGPRINQEQIKGSLMVVPEGFSYHVKKVTGKGKEKQGLMASMGGASQSEFSSSFYHKGLPRVSEELEDMIVVDIAINVPSIYLDPKSALGTVKIKGGAYLRLENARATYVSGKLKQPGAASPDKGLEILLTEPVMITGVFEQQDFKSQASKKVTTVPSYAPFFTVENTSVELTNTITCDAADYTREVGKAVNEFLDLTLSKLEAGLNGEKVK
ncbi:MAG: hypothetical protein AB7O48_15105 [Cyclobacteriaceae bacterium]